MTTVRSGITLFGAMLLIVAAASANASAQTASPFVAAGVVIDADGTFGGSTPAVIGSATLGSEWDNMGVRVTLDAPTLQNAYRRRGLSYSFLFDTHGPVAPAVRLGFLAGGTISEHEGAGLGLTAGPEVLIAPPNHRFLIVVNARLTFFFLGADSIQGLWLFRPGISLRWNF